MGLSDLHTKNKKLVPSDFPIICFKVGNIHLFLIYLEAISIKL